ncbi:CHAT domain-containing protein [Streptomyces sp. NBC_01334]|uniref:CHAT domain-containing protein n=1 Tax=Streptomyces sp. NBC_01334 TaxID=2903827 RepID=UPI002E11D006|nr:CHAT domain-containing protein [Streptomyces sp. NBC_01334]
MAEPSLDENARRLLTVIDNLPVRLPERERMVAALDMVATTEWTRVRIALPQQRIDSLLRSRPDTSAELADVFAVARTAARLYGFEHVGVGLIAVALVLTAREGSQPRDVDVVSEAFGLGHLENPSEVLNQYLLARERGQSAAGGVLQPTEGLAWGPTPKGRRRRRLALAGLYTARGAAFVALLVLAVVQHDGWLAWLVAFAAVPSSVDVRRRPLDLADDLPVGELPLRWPWHGCLAVAAAAAGLDDAAVVLTVLHLALPSIAHWGEAGEARHLCMEGREIRGTGRRTATSQAVAESYAVRRRYQEHALVLALAAAPAALLAAAADAPWPLHVLTAVFVARGLSGLAAVVATVTFITGDISWVLPAAVALGLTARAAEAWRRRPPLTRVPLDRPPASRALRSEGRAALRAHRLLRMGRPAAALRRLDAVTHDRHRPETALLRGWAMLEHGHPGDAKSAVALPGREPTGPAALITCLAELDLGNADAAEAALRGLDPTRDEWARRRRRDIRIAGFRIALLRGSAEGLTETIAREVPERVTHRNLTTAVALLRLAAESALPTRPSLAFYLAGAGLVLVRTAEPDSLDKDFGLAGRGRTVALEVVRCGALTSLADLRASREADGDTVSALSAGDGAAGFLMRLDRPIEAATYLNALADRLATDPTHRLAALKSRIEALAVLNATRHELRSTEERHQWWGVFGRTVEQAMQQAAAGADWQTLAELIESARLQLGPDKDGSAFEASRTVAPFIRVRGVSRLEQAHWYRTEQPPRVFALEDMAEIALGRGTWWWSTWVHEHTVFWSLVPSSGPVTGGTLSLAEGTEPAQALSDLRDALPGMYPGEDALAWEGRVLSSPLLVGPAHAESSLGRRLGALLPPPLSHALLEGRGGLRLAIAPAAQFGHVPWPAVGIPGGERDVRLVERCTAVLVPPAGLLAQLADRPRLDDAPPLGLVVVEPGGDLPWADEAEQLPTARQLLGLVPEGVETIAPTADLSLPDFAARLRGLGSETSAVFVCHVAEDSASGRRGVQLRPGNAEDPSTVPPRVLTSHMLIDAPDEYPMPRQVLMLACDSGDVGNVSAGEWLVLGPALLWAGADRLVVTSYPVIDSVSEPEGEPETEIAGGAGDVIDRRLLSALVRRQPVIDALHAVQREQLARWRKTGRDGAPIHWGGHLAMGAYGELGVPRSLPPLRRRYVHESVTELLDDAAGNAARAGRRTLTRWDLLVQLGLYGFETPHALRRWAGLAPVYLYVLAAEARRAVLRRRPAAALVLPDEQVMTLLKAAEAIAQAARHRIVNVEHVFAAFLGSAGVPGSVGRTIFGWDGRHPEVVKEIIGDTQDGYQHTGLPELTHLAAAAVPPVYEALKAEVPGPEDAERWHVTDRP